MEKVITMRKSDFNINTNLKQSHHLLSLARLLGLRVGSFGVQHLFLFIYGLGSCILRSTRLRLAMDLASYFEI